MLGAVLLGGLLLGSTGCALATADPWGETTGKRVVVSVPPLVSFVQAVGGDLVTVRCLCTGTGPHHYQADTNDARVLLRADLLLGIGLRLDDNFTDSLRSMARRSDLRFIKLGQRLPEKMLLEFQHSHSHSHGDDHQHNHGKWDPHIWLGIPQAIRLVELIAEELAVIDEDNRQTYASNAQTYIQTLKRLHEEGKRLLQDVKVRRIISFHEALSYLASSYDLEIAEVIEQGPGDEPTAEHLASLVKLCSDPEKPIAAIAVEPQYSRSSSAKTIQDTLRNRGVKMPLVEVDPLETAREEELASEGADWYVKRMRQNLNALREVLR